MSETLWSVWHGQLGKFLEQWSMAQVCWKQICMPSCRVREMSCGVHTGQGAHLWEKLVRELWILYKWASSPQLQRQADLWRLPQLLALKHQLRCSTAANLVTPVLVQPRGRTGKRPWSRISRHLELLPLSRVWSDLVLLHWPSGNLVSFTQNQTDTALCSSSPGVH